MSLSLRLSLIYGALFFGPGAAMPFLPVFLASRGLDAESIALALGIAQLARLFSGPMGGRLADRVGRRRPVMLGAALLGACGALLMLPSHGFAALSLAMALHGAGSAPISPLVDTVAVGAAYKSGIDFGRVRGYGSMFFIAGTFAGAWVLDGLGANAVPVLILGSLLATAAMARGLPEEQGTSLSTRGLAFVLLRRPGFALLILASGLVQGSHAAFYTLSTLHWGAAGIDANVIGALWSTGVGAEICLLFFARRLLRRLPPLLLGAISAVAAVVRWTGTAATNAILPLFLLQALHALTFAAMWLAGVSLLQRLIPAEAQATAQALLAALGPGLGLLLLTFACGPLYAALGAGSFLAMAVVAALGLGAVLLLALRCPELRA